MQQQEQRSPLHHQQKGAMSTTTKSCVSIKNQLYQKQQQQQQQKQQRQRQRRRRRQQKQQEHQKTAAAATATTKDFPTVLPTTYATSATNFAKFVKQHCHKENKIFARQTCLILTRLGWMENATKSALRKCNPLRRENIQTIHLVALPDLWDDYAEVFRVVNTLVDVTLYGTSDEATISLKEEEEIVEDDSDCESSTRRLFNHPIGPSFAPRRRVQKL